VRPSLERAVGKEHVIDSPPTMGGEDFSYYLTDLPGFYFRLGVVKAGTKSGGLHTPDFRADDTAIPVGVKAMAQVVLDYLRGGAAGAR
jgi:amidohydrolase